MISWLKQGRYNGDKIAAMRKLTIVRILILLVILCALAGFVYWLPPVHDRLSWRVDFAQAYVRGLIDPGERMAIGLFYRNPDAPRYDEYTAQGLDMSPDEKLVAISKELDRFAV